MFKLNKSGNHANLGLFLIPTCFVGVPEEGGVSTLFISSLSNTFELFWC